MNRKSFEFEISDVILRMHKKFHPWFSLHDTFTKKEPSTKLYGVFYHFSRTYEVTKL